MNVQSEGHPPSVLMLVNSLLLFSLLFLLSPLAVLDVLKLISNFSTILTILSFLSLMIWLLRSILHFFNICYLSGHWSPDLLYKTACKHMVWSFLWSSLLSWSSQNVHCKHKLPWVNHSSILKFSIGIDRSSQSQMYRILATLTVEYQLWESI